MKNPRIKFRQNKELDKWKIKSFLYRAPKAGTNFQEVIIRTHPSLKPVVKLGKEKALAEINKYIDSIYREKKEGIRRTVKRMQLDWRVVGDEFYQCTSGIFNKTPWPRGKYIAYFTISPPMPRFLDTKTFQVGYTKDGRWKVTVAHEMLHFIFYEYIRQKFTPQLEDTNEKEIEKLLEGKLAVPLWDLSEVFNVILLNEPQFQQAFPHEQKPYPQHVKLYPKLRKIWQGTNKDIDRFMAYLTTSITSEVKT